VHAVVSTLAAGVFSQAQQSPHVFASP